MIIHDHIMIFMNENWKPLPIHSRPYFHAFPNSNQIKVKKIKFFILNSNQIKVKKKEKVLDSELDTNYIFGKLFGSFQMNQ